MRKVIDSELLRMKAEGTPQKDIAVHFGVSPAFISKRLKQLTPSAMPDSIKNLTEQERAFVKAKASGKSNIQSALESYNCISRDSAKALSNGMMKKPHIQAALQDWFEYEGITKQYRAQKTKAVLDNPDHNVILKGLDHVCKVMGDYKEDQNNEGIVMMELIERARQWRKDQERRELEQENSIEVRVITNGNHSK